MQRIRHLSFIAIAALPLHAKADWWHQLLRYSCAPTKQEIRVEYIGAYNSEGQKLIATATENDINPWNLLVSEKGDEPRYILGTKKVVKHCKLSDGNYTIELGPSPCNLDVQGENGSMMQAYAIVWRGNKKIINQTFGACTLGIKRIAVGARVISARQKPIIKHISPDEYFN